MADASKNSGIHLWLVLMKAYRALSRHAMRSIEPSGLGLSDFAVLEVLLNKGPQRVNDIGRPRTAASHAVEVRSLRARSLTHAEIARRLRIDESSVRRILARPLK